MYTYAASRDEKGGNTRKLHGEKYVISSWQHRFDEDDMLAILMIRYDEEYEIWRVLDVYSVYDEEWDDPGDLTDYPEDSPETKYDNFEDALGIAKRDLARDSVMEPV